jgi:DNA polymerase-3 subunit epsilon
MNNNYIVAFDIETTGLDKNKDQIIQISLAKFNRETYEIVDTFDSYVQPVGYYTINEAAYSKHGISAEFLIGKPHLSDIAEQIIDFIGDADILGYNSMRFDIPFLKTELNKYGYDIDFTVRKCYDSFKEETRRNGNTLEQTFIRYVGHSMVDEGLEAHNSLSDIKATITIFKHQNNVSEVKAEFVAGEDGVFEEKEWNGIMKPCFTIGKYRQMPIDYVALKDQNYLKWCVSDKCTFTSSTKKFIKKYINETK